MSAKPSHKRSQFSKHEDHKLRELVQLYGENNWCIIAKNMDHRNPRQCRDRYKNYLAPSVNCSPWSYEEEMKLDMLVNYFGKKWSILCKFFVGRTEINCKCHYSMIERRKKKAMSLYLPSPAKSEPEETNIFEDIFDEFGDSFDF